MYSLFRTLLVVALLSSAFSRPIGADDNPQGRLDEVKIIYVIPMQDRLEHFLTYEIVRWRHFQVTLNPHEADAVLSDTTDVSVKELLEDPPVVRKTRARTRGTAFLISMKTERILWSAAVKPSEPFLFGGDKSSRQLAQEIVELLRKNIQPK